MTRSPMLWGAGLACALGGAVAGTALGSTPILDRPALGDYYQSHDDGEAAVAEQRVLPDHYPLVTRDGTVPVAALSDRGLFSQARYRALYGEIQYEPVTYPDAAYEPASLPSRTTASDTSLRIGDPELVDDPAAGAANEPLDLAAGPASISGVGSAKTLDVAAVLAMR